MVIGLDFVTFVRSCQLEYVVVKLKSKICDFNLRLVKILVPVLLEETFKIAINYPKILNLNFKFNFFKSFQDFALHLRRLF